MRVLHIYTGNLFGGIETFLATLARFTGQFPEVEPHFALCFEGRLSEELRQESAPLTILPAVRARFPWSVWKARQALRRLLRRDRYDAVVCHSPWPMAVFGPAVRAEGAPLVFWLHEVISGRGWITRWARRTAPDLTICASHFIARSLGRLYPGSPAETVHLPVQLRPRAPASREAVRAQLDTPADARVIIQVSRLEPWKGHDLLFQALARLRDRPGWVCWQVGGVERAAEARYLERLRRRARRAGILERVRFLGRRSDVPSLLAAADIHCQPNTAPEHFGITFVEGLIAGLPVVTTALGGALEIVDASCGSLVPPDSPGELAGALKRLLDDPALCEQLGAGGRARARHLCDPARQINRLNAVLVRAVGRPAVGAPVGARLVE
jgi:glycosyltransferase involved in cell wall biosynthesis